MGSRFNEPVFYEVLGITNGILRPSNKIDGNEMNPDIMKPRDSEYFQSLGREPGRERHLTLCARAQIRSHAH